MIARLLALTCVGLLFFNIGVATASTDDCMICDDLYGKKQHVRRPAVPKMLCFDVKTSREYIVLRIGVLHKGDDLRRDWKKLVDDQAHLLYAPPKIRANAPICIGEWRVRKADFISFCDEVRSNVGDKADIAAKIKNNPRTGGWRPNEPIDLR